MAPAIDRGGGMPLPALILPPSASEVGYDAEMRRARGEPTWPAACSWPSGRRSWTIPLRGSRGTAKGCGAAPVIVHREPAGLDDLAHLVIAAVIGPTLDAAGGWVALTRGIPT